jgi:Flp pilus assembly protein TadG
MSSTQSKAGHRDGAAAVEFALVAPLMIALVMGSIQTGYNFDSTTKVYSSIRQSGRLATLDNATDYVPDGQTLNSKVISDIKNSLTAEGLPGSAATVTITHAEGASAGSAFDLSSANNDLKYFKIEATVPYSAVNTGGFLPNTLTQLRGSVVFRKGGSTLIQ